MTDENPYTQSAPLTLEVLNEAIRQVQEDTYRPQNYPTFPEGFISAVVNGHSLFTDRERNRLSPIIAQLPMPLHPDDHRFLVEAMERWGRR